MHEIAVMMTVGGTISVTLVAMAIVQWRETELRHRERLAGIGVCSSGSCMRESYGPDNAA